jgi:multidrug efflux pump subunit AcrA (membrane-fusion protein)
MNAMNRMLSWTLGVVVLCVLGVLLFRSFLEGRKELAQERESEKPIKVAPRVAHGEVTLEREAQEKGGLVVQPLPPADLRPEVVAYGALEEDPSASFVVRAPGAGVVGLEGGARWPAIGETLKEGTTVGVLTPLVGPREGLDLAAQRDAARSERAAADATAAEARASERSADAAVAGARAALERTTKLHDEGRLASDRALEEARVRLADAEAKLAAAHARSAAASEEAELAKTRATRLEETLKGGVGSFPLVAREGGEVVEVLAHPGESVEQGAALLRLARFDRLIAHVELPAGRMLAEVPSAARVAILGAEGSPLPAESVAVAPGGPGPHGQQFLVRVRTPGPALRPGAAVTAYLVLSGEARKGTVVPRSAVVRADGRAWAYAQLADDRFARREVDVTHPLETGYFVAELWKAGDRVVTSGAQLLLSEERKAQIRVGEEGE